jgi:hypothetical protein
LNHKRRFAGIPFRFNHWQWTGAACSGRSCLALSPCATRKPRETGKGRSRTEVGARNCLKGASTVVRALPVTRAERQATNRDRHRNRARAVGLHLGDQSRGHDRSTGITWPEAVDHSSRVALNRPTAPTLQFRSNKDRQRKTSNQSCSSEGGTTAGELPKTLRGRSLIDAAFRPGQPQTNKRKCGIQPAHQSLFTDVFRSRPLSARYILYLNFTLVRGEKNYRARCA